MDRLFSRRRLAWPGLALHARLPSCGGRGGCRSSDRSRILSFTCTPPRSLKYLSPLPVGLRTPRCSILRVSFSLLNLPRRRLLHVHLSEESLLVSLHAEMRMEAFAMGFGQGERLRRDLSDGLRRQSMDYLERRVLCVCGWVSGS